MSQSGLTVDPDCITTFNELKLGRSKDSALKFIIFALSKDFKSVIVEEKSSEKDYEVFYNKLTKSVTASKTGKEGPGCRFAVYDFEWDTKTGEGRRSKIAFISFVQDLALIQPRMVYASSKESLKRALSGIGDEIQASEPSDIEYDEVIAKVSKGTA